VITYESPSTGNVAFVEPGGDPTDTGKNIDPGGDGGYVGRVADFDDDGTLEIPAGTPDGEILLIDAGNSASTDTLAVDARGSNRNGPSALAIGDVTGNGEPQIIFAENSGDIKRVGPQGSASKIVSSDQLSINGAGAILGYGDFNRDGDSDIVYLDTGGGVGYYDDGADTGVSAAAGNTNAGGDLADYDLDGTLEVTIVNGSGQIELVDQNGTDETLQDAGSRYDVVTKKPVGGVNWEGNDSLEVIHRNSDDGKLYTIGIGSAAQVVEDASGNSISASEQVGTAGNTGAGGTFTMGTNTTSIDLQGTNGNEGNPGDPNSLGGDAGWRMIGPPVDGANAQDLKSPADTDGSVIEFNLDSGDDMFYKWDDTQSGGGDWAAVSDGTTTVTDGRGYLLFLFDDAGTPNADPLNPELTLYADAGSEASGDVAVSGLDTGANFHLLANPYNQAFDLRSLEDESNSGLDGSTEFSSTVQVWDGGPSSAEDQANTAGSYVTFDVTTNAGEMIDDVEDKTDGSVVSAWQGFFVERTGSSDTQLTFRSGGRTATDGEERDVVGDEKSRAPGREPARIGFKLTVENSDGMQVARDEAASLYFHPDATTEADGFDASKLTPLTHPYATIGPVGPTAASDTAIKAQESRPMDAESPLKVPFRVQTAGAIEGTAHLRATQWHEVPSGWSLTLVDTKGTDTPADDVETALTRSDTSEYTFAIETPEKRATARRHPTRLDGDASQTQGASTPRPRRPEALRLADTPENKTLSAADSIPRFTVRVTASGDRLPVELAAFDARATGRRARLSWQTAGETNNAGFYVQHRPLPSGEETTTPTDNSPAEWSSVGFVEGAGTTGRSRRYAFETEELSPGPHAFRLRQIDMGGRAAYSQPLEVTVAMEASHMVSGPSPNPVRGGATLDVAVRRAQDVQVALYNVLGQRVATAYRGTLPGEETTTLRVDASWLSSGVYFARVDGEDFTTTKRLTVVR
jgi:hypothetical protein